MVLFKGLPSEVMVGADVFAAVLELFDAALAPGAG
jgi:hypothetical protein